MAGVYAFRLDRIHAKSIRSNRNDVDIVNFSVLVNEVQRGRGSAVFPLWNGSNVPTHPDGPPNGVAPDIREGMARNWVIGPFELEDADTAHVVYTGTNTSDGSLSDQDFERLQLDILNSIIGAAIGSIGGPIGALVGAIAGAIEDIAGTVLGWEREGPCNGLVFADAVKFRGDELAQLSFEEQDHNFPNASRAVITKEYTDEATHPAENCGDIARTAVTFWVIRVEGPLKVKSLALRKRSIDFTQGLLQLAPTDQPVSVKNLIGLRA